MLVMGDPGGATIITTPWAVRATVRACERPPTSARTTARSAVPAAKALAASRALPELSTLNLTGESVVASRPAVKSIGHQRCAGDDAQHAGQQDGADPKRQGNLKGFHEGIRRGALASD